MRIRVALLLTIIVVVITGCTVEASRIYIVCRYDNGAVSCYKNANEFYDVDVNGNLLPTIDPTLRAYPILTFTPTQGDYNFEPDVPNLYHGCKVELEHYVYRLLENDFDAFEIIYSDYQRLEIKVYSQTTTYRILYNIYGEIRVYSENNSPILYINE